MVFDLTKEVTLLGRDVTNDIVLGDPEVSRQHARLTHTPAGYILEDLGSTNGTFVNGERLVTARALAAGNLLGFGEDVTVTFDALTPEAAATVMAAAARPAPAPRMQAPATPLPPPPPTPAGIPTDEAKPTSRRSWVMAGCGCLVLIVTCVVFLFFMDSFFPDILYAPLRMFGF
jgi:pSer/pThr/pTyr-binding forkhead associated (FHA) protein